MTDTPPTGNNFLRGIIQDDIDSGRLDGPPVTRFPPEPNGYLHIGHAASICLNFGLAEHFGGHCHLRFDDTNPGAESQEFIDSIMADIRWLGFSWHGEVRYASAYFDTLHEYALHLIRKGLAYVCDLSPDEAREYRGTLTEPGRNSPFRDRTPEENEALFARMRAGEFDEGSRVLRAKIDMAAPNMNLRDPIIYRIRKVAHHQTGDTWCIYPTYDFTHGQSDAIEGITHSICTLEFEDHRPLYDWFIENLPVPSRPRQYEFARRNLSYTVTSKRKLRMLVDEGHVAGWDDPRMPTISGLRRRGCPAVALRRFCDEIGVSRSDSVVDVAQLEHVMRDELNENAARAMCVLDPVKLIITNFDEDAVETLRAPGHPFKEGYPERELPFTREIWIEREDFRIEANKKFKRLVLGKKVRLRNAYVIQADEVVESDTGEIEAILCRYDPDTLGADPADGVKPKGVIHWVSASHGRRAELRLYDRLFSDPHPERGEGDIRERLNPESLRVLKDCPIEPALASTAPGTAFQFERQAYFVADAVDHSPEAPVFNRIVALRDSWAKIESGR